jgi:signal transduction histidine kinase
MGPFGRIDERAAIQDEERRRIGREIHDSVGQHLTALRLSLDYLCDNASVTPSLSDQIAKARRIAEELDRSLDAMTRQLAPVGLEQFGLAEALHRLVDDWSERFGIPAESRVRDIDSLRLLSGAASHLYRLVQEALHNVVKHARATSVSVTLMSCDGHFVLLIEDDGQGFEVAALTSAATPRRGAGVPNMRERAALAGGTFEIESSPGHGTTIIVRMPVAARAVNGW